MTTCAICGLPFEAKTSYGLCPLCINATTLKEFDKCEAAIKQAKREGFRSTLTLVEWLATVSDTNGKCLYCMENHAYYIERVDPDRGLSKDNAVPICGACHQIKTHGWQRAEARVAAYLAGKVSFRVEGLDWHPAPEKEEEEVKA